MTASSRRDLLKTGSLAGLAALVPLRATARARSGAALTAPLASRTLWPLRSTFAGQLGTTFWVGRRGLRPLRLRLESVDDLASAKANGTSGFEECFSLAFVAPGGARLGQGTYRLEHASLGTIEAFIVPVGPAGKLRVYEAIYNHQTA